MGLPWWLRGKGAWKAGDRGSNPGSERSPGGGHRNPLQYSCLGDPRIEEPGGLQSVQLQRAGQDLSDWTTTTNVLKCNFSNEWNEPIHYRFGKDKMWYKDQPPLCSLFPALPHPLAYPQPPGTTQCSLSRLSLYEPLVPALFCCCLLFPSITLSKTGHMLVLQDCTVAVSASKLGCTLGAPEFKWTHCSLGSRCNSELLSSAACPPASFHPHQCHMNILSLGHLRVTYFSEPLVSDETSPLKKKKKKWLWHNMSVCAYDCKMYVEP